MTNKPIDLRAYLISREGYKWDFSDTEAVLRHVRRKCMLEDSGRDPERPCECGPFYCAKHAARRSDITEANCPCWATGSYVWVDGCRCHPRESVT